MRWHPLRMTNGASARTQDRVLVMGLGPSGLTLMHHLWMAGYQVMGLDGLKVEPLLQQWLDAPIYEHPL